MKPLEEIYPRWGDNCEDPALHNLIVNIFEDKFVKGYWDVKLKKSNPQKGKIVEVKQKRKKRAEEEVSEPAKKKEKRGVDSGKKTRWE